MMLRVRNVDLVPYGVDRWSFADMKVAGFSSRGLLLDASFPCTSFDVPTVRLHHLRYELAGLADEDGTMPPRDPARAYFRQICSPWDRTALAFIGLYFARIHALLAHAGEAFERRVATFAGLYKPADWATSAPAPLPRAHLFAPAPGPDRAPSEADFLRVDVAFRSGGRTVALISDASFPTPKSARSARERLEGNGILVFPIKAAEGEAALAAVVDAALGEAESRFWEADAIPRGITSPAGLGV